MPNSRNYASTAVHLAVAWSIVAWCRTVEVGTGAEVSVRHFGTSVEMSWV